MKNIIGEVIFHMMMWPIFCAIFGGCVFIFANLDKPITPESMQYFKYFVISSAVAGVFIGLIMGLDDSEHRYPDEFRKLPDGSWLKRGFENRS